MKNTIKLLVLTLALVACGDNKGAPDARPHPDGPPADALCSNCPAAPTLGAQIDRMGRPAINTALNNPFNPNSAAASTAKESYNTNTDPSTWTSFVPEFESNLAIIDSLDTGICGNGVCETGEKGATAVGAGTVCADCTTLQVGTANGCGNQVLYDNQAATKAAYQTLASILAFDELYVDTTKTTCAFYLAVEFGVATGLGNTTCGGRAPQYDVMDFSYSVIAMGIKGFSTDGNFTPAFKDNAEPHTDYLTTFPYLGAPH